MKTFMETIGDNEPILFDGAIATELYRKGVFINKCFEEISVSKQSLIESIHADYLAAGARVLTTNTWGANAFKLGSHSLHDKIQDLNIAAAKIARNVAGDKAWVAGSLGPLGVVLEPLGATAISEARECFAQQAQFLEAGGVDLLILETFSDIRELEIAVEAVRSVSQLPLIATVAVPPEAQLADGGVVSDLTRRLAGLSVDSVGFNCSFGPQPLFSYVERLREVTSKPICVQPNAGLPKVVDGRKIYMSTPEYFAHFAKQFCQVGVKFVGGCCGSSPDHTRAMSNALRFAKANYVASVVAQTAVEVGEDKPVRPETLPEDRSRWAAKIAKGEVVTSIELLPLSRY